MICVVCGGASRLGGGLEGDGVRGDHVGDEVGLWGQVYLAWAPPQKEQVCRNLQPDKLQPLSLKLLQIILPPWNMFVRPRLSCPPWDVGPLPCGGAAGLGVMEGGGAPS